MEISPRLQFMYKLSVSICFLFASLVIGLFTLIIADGSFEPSTDRDPSAGLNRSSNMDCDRWLSPLLMEKRYQPAQCGGSGRFNCYRLDHVPRGLYGPR